MIHMLRNQTISLHDGSRADLILSNQHGYTSCSKNQDVTIAWYR